MLSGYWDAEFESSSHLKQDHFCLVAFDVFRKVTSLNAVHIILMHHIQ